MGKSLKIVNDVILILIIVILCLYFILRFFNLVMIYKVQTGSMEDNIHAGDYILIVKSDNYKIGDIITFRVDNGFVTHRIISKNGNSFITKGDANNVEDDSINKNKIIGKVILNGGVLNLVIKFKYTIAGILLSFYLFSCYFTNKKNES